MSVFTRVTRTSRSLRLIAGLCIAAVALGACGGGEKDGAASDSATLLAGPPIAAVAVPLVMETEGLDKANGVDLDVQASGTVPTNMAAVMGGDAAFALATRNAVFDAAAEGNDNLVIVASTVGRASACMLRTDLIEEIGLPENATVEQKLEAMKGLTIASTPEGTSVNLETVRVFKKVGMDPSKDLTIVPVTDPGAIVAGIKQKKFDGTCYGVGVLEPLIVAGDVDYWLVAGRGDFDEYMEPGIGGVIITRRDIVEENAELVSKVFDALVDAEQLIADQPDEVGARVYPDWYSSAPQPAFELAWKESLPTFPRDGKFTRANFESALKDVAGDTSKIDYEDIVYEKARD